MKYTMEDVARRANEIKEQYTCEQLLKMDIYQLNIDALQQAHKELQAMDEESLTKYLSKKFE